MGKSEVQVIGGANAMEEMFVQAARLIGSVLLELFWYQTARLLLPLVSLGSLQVQPLAARYPAAWWWQRPFRRLPSGRIEVSIAMASLIGFLTWVALILVMMSLLS